VANEPERSGAGETPSPGGAGQGQPGKPGKGGRRGLLERPLLLFGGLGAFGLVAIAALIWWLNARNYESTDDAYVDTHIVRLAPQAAGRVMQVLVDDNALVSAGQPVMIIDSADVDARLAQAQAQKAQAQAQADNAKAQIAINQAAWRQSLADLVAARAPAANAAADLARYRQLQSLNALAVAQQQIDQATSQARQTAAQSDAAVKAALSRRTEIGAARSQLAAARQAVRAAEAQVSENNVQLGYTRLVAPEAGHVTARSVAAGNYVQPGTQVMAIVPLRVWVTANFKETQLKLMRPGESVAIKVDACPEDHLRGHVDSIQRGAGQAFGVLPPENATGNFVKVVQRVPVKIVFDETPRDCILGPGMSVTPTVRVR
jgi:membrane fusion protein, multidrug efflux system